MERGQDFLTHELDSWRPWSLVPRPVRIGRVFPRRDFFGGTRLFSKKVLDHAARIQATQAAYYPRHETEAQSTSPT